LRLEIGFMEGSKIRFSMVLNMVFGGFLGAEIGVAVVGETFEIGYCEG
jgi:hypothetical protein